MLENSFGCICKAFAKVEPALTSERMLATKSRAFSFSASALKALNARSSVRPALINSDN